MVSVSVVDSVSCSVPLLFHYCSAPHSCHMRYDKCNLVKTEIFIEKGTKSVELDMGCTGEYIFLKRGIQDVFFYASWIMEELY